MTRLSLIVLLILTVPLGLAACGKTDADATAAADPHAGHDHGDHAGHDHAAKDGAAASGVKMSHASAEMDPKGIPAVFDTRPEVGTKAMCPVMEDGFIVAENTLIAEYEGKFYAFCCKECGPRFEAEPVKYVARAAELDKVNLADAVAPAGG